MRILLRSTGLMPGSSPIEGMAQFFLQLVEIVLRCTDPDDNNRRQTDIGQLGFFNVVDFRTRFSQVRRNRITGSITLIKIVFDQFAIFFFNFFLARFC